MEFDFKFRKSKVDIRCRLCGPLVCRAEREGFLGHVAFFIYLSFSLLVAGILLIGLGYDRYTYFYGWHFSLSEFMLFLSVVFGGLRIFYEGVEELVEHRAFSTDFLVLIASVGAIFIHAFLEAALVVNLFVLAEYLETIAIYKAEKSIESLVRLLPSDARVLRDDREIMVPITKLGVGDIVIVRPGERIPADGTIIRGSTNVDLSLLTGESLPVFRSVGDEVYAGTICLDGELYVRVERVLEDSLFSRIIKLVLEAKEKKTRLETFISRFSNYYVSAVLLLVLLVATLPPIVFGEPAITWFYRALVLLVLSCPCALIISIPTGIVAGIVNASRNGILVKGGNYLEIAREIKVAAFDKTGTLTKGELEVSDVVILDSKYTREELLSFVGSIEKSSTHPIAKAVVRYVEKIGIGYRDVEEFREIPGKGVVGILDGIEVLIGNTRLLVESGIVMREDISSRAREFEEQGKKVLFVAVNHEVLALIALKDPLREESRGVIEDLRRRGLKIVLLTGDSEVVARNICKDLGINEYYSELTPIDKVNIIRQLEEEVGPVMMVGDGINDAPAIINASLGIAMGGRGVEVSIENAGVVLLNDDLRSVPYLIDISRRAIGITKINIAVSIITKVLLVVLATLGMVTLILAVLLGDDGLSILVTMNAMRILKYKGQSAKI